MKKTRRILIMLLAVVIILASRTVPAIAAEQGLTVDTDTENGSLIVTKILTVGKNATIPNEEFTFRLEPVDHKTDMISEGQTIKSGVAVKNNEVTIAFTESSSTKDITRSSDEQGIKTDAAYQKYAKATGTISFAGAYFKAPGIYRYSLFEVVPSTPASGMTYDLSRYYVDLYVGFESAAAKGSEMKILGMKAFRYQAQDGTAVEKAAEKESIVFSNNIDSYSLVISKTVTGNLGDRNKEFSFYLLVGASLQLPAGSSLTAVKTDADSMTSFVTVIVGNGYSFTLKHGEKLEVLGLPQDMSYYVSENNYSADGYTTSLVTYENGIPLECPAFYDSNNRIVAGGNIEAFTNNKSITIPTGILLDVWPYVLVLLLAGAAAVLMISQKRRRTGR